MCSCTIMVGENERLFIVLSWGLPTFYDKLYILGASSPSQCANKNNNEPTDNVCHNKVDLSDFCF
jgi:hypothetical protein